MTEQTSSILFTAIAMTIAAAIALYSWRRSRAVAIVSITWATISLFTARIPFFRHAGRWADGDLLGFMAFGSVVAVPVAMFFIALARSEAFQRFMNDTPSWVLIGSQLYRLTGAGFLVLYLQGLLPAEIGMVNGVLDIAVGITAIPVAWTVFRGFALSRRLAIAWNIIGICDLASAFTVVTASILGLIELEPDPTRMGLYPLSLISVYQVAIALCIHIYLARRLLRPGGTPAARDAAAS